MAAPKGHPRWGGRQKGTKNKATVDVKVLAQEHGPEAIKTLCRLMREADSDAAKISAAKELLDRAYGKATQHVTGEIAMRPLTELTDEELAAIIGTTRGGGGTSEEAPPSGLTH